MGEGETAFDGVGAYSLLLDYAAFQPRDLIFHIDREFRDGKLRIAEKFLSWMHATKTPQAWDNDYGSFKYNQNNGFFAYDVETRSRTPGQAWGPWQTMPLSNNPPTFHSRLFISGDEPNLLTLTEFQSRPRLTVDGAGSCQDREWQVRALYDTPQRHSAWVTTGEYNTPTLKAPPRPERDKPSSWLQSAGANSYNLRFAWKDSNIRCWSNTTHQVQRRHYESGAGWSAWTTLPDKSGNAGFHEESFTGTRATSSGSGRRTRKAGTDGPSPYCS